MVHPFSHARVVAGALLWLAALVGCESAEKPAADTKPATPAALPSPTVPSPTPVAPSVSPPESVPLVAPFDVEFVRKARWAAGREGFDAKLPGYHFAGDIARVRFVPRAADPKQPGKPPATIVITIQTSPGMPPNLENLTLSAGGLVLSTALSTGGDGKNVIELRDAKAPANAARMVPQSDYLELKAQDGAVHVRLLQPAMELLKQGGELSWIDWYRG